MFKQDERHFLEQHAIELEKAAARAMNRSLHGPAWELWQRKTAAAMRRAARILRIMLEKDKEDA